MLPSWPITPRGERNELEHVSKDQCYDHSNGENDVLLDDSIHTFGQADGIHNLGQVILDKNDITCFDCGVAPGGHGDA